MAEIGKSWLPERRAQLIVVGFAVAASLVLSVLCDSDPDTGFRGFDPIACAALAFFVWPIALATAVPLPHPWAIAILLAFWPAFAACGYRFVVRRQWSFAVPVVALIVVPAISAARAFEMMMSA